jgi:predicted phosphodiesterase
MQLAIFSDVHGNLTALEAVLADYRALAPEGADAVWMLGDVAAMGPRPNECARLFMAMADEAERRAKAAHEAGAPPPRGTFHGVRGNTDRYLVTGTRSAGKPADSAEALAEKAASWAMRDAAFNWTVARLGFDEYTFLRGLRGECDLTVPGFGTVIGYHGTPGDDEGRLTPDTDDEEAEDALLDREGVLGIGGHIHVQMDRTLRNGWRVLNVGSIGMSYDRPGFAQWAMLTFTDGEVAADLRAVPYDVDAVIADLRAQGFPALATAERRLREGEK